MGQACMRGWQSWPSQRDEGGLRVVACPHMGELAVSPRYGHPVSIPQARREFADKKAREFRAALLESLNGNA